MKITTEHLDKIRSELKELAGGDVAVKVKKDTHISSACRVEESEINERYGYTIRLNPARIRTPNQLEQHLQFCRNSVVGV